MRPYVLLLALLLAIPCALAGPFSLNSSIVLNTSVSNSSMTFSVNISLDQLDYTTTNITLTNVTCPNGAPNLSQVFWNTSNANRDSSVFCDPTFPQVNITFPSATTYSLAISALNYTVTEANLASCWYSLNSGLTNTTITCGNNVTGLSSSEGSNTWRVYANDSAGNLNSSTVSFTVSTSSGNSGGGGGGGGGLFTDNKGGGLIKLTTMEVDYAGIWYRGEEYNITVKTLDADGNGVDVEKVEMRSLGTTEYEWSSVKRLDTGFYVAYFTVESNSVNTLRLNVTSSQLGKVINEEVIVTVIAKSESKLLALIKHFGKTATQNISNLVTDNWLAITIVSFLMIVLAFIVIVAMSGGKK